MYRSLFPRGMAISLLLTAWCIPDGGPCKAADSRRRPNVVVILCDDLGYGDLGCYGHPEIQTPNIDSLADEGMRLTNCYAAAANCSPARTGLMTGRSPYRVGVHNWIPYDSPVHVSSEEVTVATLLRDAGYDTCHVGKWHMNGRLDSATQPQPSDHGFNHWFATQNNALPSHEHPDNFVRNGEPVGPLRGYSAHLLVDEATDWLDTHRDTANPFFLFVCFHEPHEPIGTAKRYMDLYPSPDNPSRAAHHGNITQMDDAFGRLVKVLDDRNLRDNTLLLFTSDNGPAITNMHPHGSSGPLREKKGHLYEGGIRVPGIIRYPSHVTPGSLCDEPVCGVDLLPTLCEIAQAPLPDDRPLDGASFTPIFQGRPIQRTTPLYWQYHFAASEPKVAMRIGDWKILGILDQPDLAKPNIDITRDQQRHIKTAQPVRFELYNLANDIGETTDLADRQPERLKQMAARLVELNEEVRTESPTWPDWVWPRFESSRIKAAKDAGIWPMWVRDEKADE